MSVKQLFDLSGKTALITGGSRGLGLQMAEALGEMGAKLAGVREVGHLHVWTLSDRSTIATLHVTPAPGTDAMALPARVAAALEEAHHIGHATVQVDPPGAIAAARH